MGIISIRDNTQFDYDDPAKIVKAGLVDDYDKKEKSVSVDVDSITDFTDHVPCSKLVNQLGNSLSCVDNMLSTQLSSVEDSVLEMSELIIDETELLSAFLSSVSPLLSCKVVRYKGMSSTDPSSGIVTVDGIKYVVSSDFDDKNNGDIYYHHKRFTSADGTTSTKLYAYIYAYHTFNYAEVPETSDGTEISGKFYRIGYGFYDNLSTLIHDDMIDDNANIQMRKISGLLDLTDTLICNIINLSNNLSIHTDAYSDAIEYLSAQIDMINVDLSNYIKTDDFNKQIADINGKFNSYVPFNNVIKELVDYELRNITDDKKIPSVKAFKEYLLNYAEKYHTHEVSDITDIDDLTAQIKINVSSDLSNIFVQKSYIHTCSSQLCVDEIVKLGTGKNNNDIMFLSTHIPNLRIVDFILRRVEPMVGTVRYVINDELPNTIAINDNFDGWTYPNTTIACQAGQFLRAKEAFGVDPNATIFNTPTIATPSSSHDVTPMIYIGRPGSAFDQLTSYYDEND